MKLTIKDISIIVVVGAIFSVAAVWLLGFTSAIAFPGWMGALMTESITPERSLRVFYFYVWDIFVVHFLAAGIPFIFIFSGLLWWLGKASYSIFGIFLFVYLIFQYVIIPLWYGGLGPFSLSFYIVLQPVMLLLCTYLVVTFFQKNILKPVQ